MCLESSCRDALQRTWFPQRYTIKSSLSGQAYIQHNCAFHQSTIPLYLYSGIRYNSSMLETTLKDVSKDVINFRIGNLDPEPFLHARSQRSFLFSALSCLGGCLICILTLAFTTLVISEPHWRFGESIIHVKTCKEGISMKRTPVVVTSAAVPCSRTCSASCVLLTQHLTSIQFRAEDC